MAKNITIRVPGKHPQTGEVTTFELKGQRMDIDIGGQAVPFLIHGRGVGTSLTGFDPIDPDTFSRLGL